MEEAAGNIVEITLNYHGSDVILNVDEGTANVLLNDPDEAERYLDQINVVMSDEEMPSTSFSEVAPQKVWSSKRSSEVDNEATLYFLKLRSQMDAKFSDKKTLKSSLWKEIAREMIKKGFYLGEEKEGADKCRQKFANLQKQYFGHVRHMGTTGARKKDAPPYFTEMHDILGSKDRANPENLQDTLEQDEIIEELETTETGEEAINNASTSTNRFAKIKKSVRPSSHKEILELMEKHHKQAKEDRDRQFSILEDMLRQQNQQRERMLQQFERFVNVAEERNKKRKERNSDSE